MTALRDQLAEQLRDAGIDVLEEREEPSVSDPATVAYLMVTPEGQQLVAYLNPTVELDDKRLAPEQLLDEILTRFRTFSQRGPSWDQWSSSQHGRGHYLYLRLRRELPQL